METDIGSWTPFYEGLVNGTPHLLDCMTKRNVKATYFFTADSAKTHPEVVSDVKNAGHEVGCHSLYHETIGKDIFPIPGVYPLLSHEVKPRIELATKIVEDVYGDKVVSFRCPRLFGSTDVVNALENLGYLSDASYPMYYFKDRLIPYHPSVDDWTKEGNLKILEIPNFADMTMTSKDPYGRDRDQWPLFRAESAEALMVHVKSFVDYASSKYEKICLCFYFHPWEFWPMPQGPIHYGEGAVIPDPFIVKNCGDYALHQFDLLIQMLQDMDSSFVTAKTLAENY
jgi:hypothetical protein